MPLMWVTVTFLLGIIAARNTSGSLFLWGLIAAAGLGLFLLSRLRRYTVSEKIPVNPFVLIVVFTLAGFWFQFRQPDIDAFHIAWYNDREYELLVTGVIAELPDARDSYTNLKIDVSKVDTGNEQTLIAHGMILARVSPHASYAYGQTVRLRGYLQTPPESEDFSYKEYLARHGIHAYMPRAEVTFLPYRQTNWLMGGIYALKAASLERLYQLFPDPEASLLAGILLGVERGIPPDLQQAFKDTGTAHIIAISGFNISILAGLFVAVFGRMLGARRGALAAVVGIGLYTVLVGADASVVRAAIMGGLALFARQVGRRQDGLNTLFAVALIMTIFNPLVLWDVGFQLSFGATLGLILYAQPFQQAAETMLAKHTSTDTAKKIASPLAEYVLFTIAAQITTIPIIAYHFGRISVISLLVNPVILPAQPPVMIFGGLTLIFGLIWQPLGQLAAYLTWPFVGYTIRMVELFDQVPHGVIVLGDLRLLFVIVFYAVLLGLTFYSHRLTVFRHVFHPVVWMIVLALFTSVLWRQFFAAPDGRLHLTFLETGSTDAILVKTPTGGRMLINGGSSPSRLSDGLGRRMPPLNRQLDWLVIASTQEQQVAALPRVLDRFVPANALWAGKRESSFAARQLNAWLIDAQVPVTIAQPGHQLDLGNGALLEMIDVNARGAVLMITWQHFRAVLPIGMTFDAQVALLNDHRLRDASLLLLTESGYAPINPPEWIDHLNPQVIVLNVSAQDRDGLPHEQTMQNIAGYSLLRTDQHGWIHISTDGQNLWVEVERK